MAAPPALIAAIALVGLAFIGTIAALLDLAPRTRSLTEPEWSPSDRGWMAAGQGLLMPALLILAVIALTIATTAERVDGSGAGLPVPAEAGAEL